MARTQTMSWFRWHHGSIYDPKWRVIAIRAKVPAPTVIAVWACILENASQSVPRGKVIGWCHEDVAAALNIDEEDVKAVWDVMQGKVLDGDYVKAWDKRQPKREDPDSTERSRQHRNALQHIATQWDAESGELDEHLDESEELDKKPVKSDMKRNGTHCNTLQRIETPEERRVEKSRELQLTSNNNREKLSTELSTLADSVRTLLPKNYRAGFDQLIERIPEGNRLSWLSEIHELPNGMHGPALDWPEIGLRIRDYVGNGAEISLRLFRAYMRNEQPRSPIGKAGSNSKSQKADEGLSLVEAGDLIKRVRDNRHPEFFADVVVDFPGKLTEREKKAINTIGGIRSILKDKDETAKRIEQAQLAKILLSLPK